MILVLGDAGDARGFALAGAAAVQCRTVDDVRAALEAFEGDRDAGADVVFVSEAVRALAPREFDRLAGRAHGPLIAVMPATGGAR